MLFTWTGPNEGWLKSGFVIIDRNEVRIQDDEINCWYFWWYRILEYSTYFEKSDTYEDFLVVPVATIFFLQNPLTLPLSVTLIPRKPTKENNDDIDSEQQGCEIKLPIDI